MCVSSKVSSRRPALGDRTNLRNPSRPTPTTVRFANTLESPKSPTTSASDKILQSCLRQSRRYGNTKAIPSQTTKPQGTMQERLMHRREFEPDTTILIKVASFLESKLADIQGAHKAALNEIEEQKKKKMAKIYLEVLTEHKLAQHQQKQEAKAFEHDMQVLRETIETLRENNQIIHRENQELIDEIEEMQEMNQNLSERSARYHKASLKIRKEIAEQEEKNRELQTTFNFMKMRKKEYENARFEADQDIEDEHAQARELRKKIERVVAELDQRCSERGFSEAVSVSVSKTFASLEATTPLPTLCA